MDQALATPSPPRLSYLALFARFLGFGLLAFGGPVAQIAMIRRELVEQDGWLSSARFNRLLAVMQVLPGPEAHELCVHLGIAARGRLGGLLAGLGFMLPGFILMMGAAAAYVALAPSLGAYQTAFLGIQVAVIAVIVRAVYRIGRHVLEDRVLIAIAATAVIASLAGASFWIILAAGATVYPLAHGGRKGLALGIAVLAIVLMAAQVVLARGADPIEIAPVAAASAGATALFWAGLKAGLLTFGGAYTAIPYVRADTVQRGWVTDAQFLDGVALANVLPAPLVIFCTFVGYVAGGWLGAVAITVGVFLPAFGFSMIFYQRLETLVEEPRLHRMLAGVAAAAVGIIAATSLQLAWSTAERVPSLLTAAAIFAVALAIVWVWKGRLAVPVLIVLAGVAGYLAFPR